MRKPCSRRYWNFFMNRKEHVMEQKRQKKNKSIKDWAIFLTLVLVAAACIFYLAHYFYENRKGEAEFEILREETETAAAEAVQTEAIEEIVETEEATEETIYCDPVYDFEELQVQNEDIYAWIVVPGTMIDYPVLQSETDNYYLDYNLDHSKGYPGCIYTNKCNAKDFSDYNTVLYGHNMRKGTMFGSLHRYEDREFFDTYQEIFVYTPDRRLTYEVKEIVKFSDVYIPAQYPVEEKEGRDAFLEATLDYTDDPVSYFRDDVEVGDEDKLITLSTCVSGERHRRYLLIGVLKEEAYYR